MRQDMDKIRATQGAELLQKSFVVYLICVQMRGISLSRAPYKQTNNLSPLQPLDEAEADGGEALDQRPPRPVPPPGVRDRGVRQVDDGQVDHGDAGLERHADRIFKKTFIFYRFELVDF